MSNKHQNEKLNAIEKRNLIIKASIEAIPYIGGSLSTLYFDAKEERRLKRLENFYEDFNGAATHNKDKFAPIEEHDREALFAIIEELNEKIETEHLQQKLEYFKTFLTNTLIQPTRNENYDERRYFLQTLSTMTLLECQVLSDLYQQVKEVEINSINKSAVDEHVIIGVLNRLKTYGFVSLRQFGIANSDFVQIYSNQELYKISEYGKRFCEFCLKDVI